MNSKTILCLQKDEPQNWANILEVVSNSISRHNCLANIDWKPLIYFSPLLGCFIIELNGITWGIEKDGYIHT